MLVFTPDGRRLAECGEVGKTVRVWDVGSGRLVHKLEPPGPDQYGHRFLAISPDGNTLAASGYRRNWNGAVHLWNPETGEFRGRLSAGGTSAGWVAISPDSQLLAVSTDGAIKVWELATHKELAADDKAHQGYLGKVAVAANGLVATASDDHTVRIWEMSTGRQRLKLSHDSWVRAVALSPDGSLLASSSLDDTVRLWDMKTGRELYKLPGHGEQGGRRLLGFSADGKRFLSWGDDYYLRIWDVATGKAVLEHRIRPAGMKVPDEDSDERFRFFHSGDAAFSADRKLFVLCQGLTALLFDVATGKEVRALKTELRELALALSPDGKLLLAGGSGEQIKTPLPDGRVRYSLAEEHPLDLWDLSSGKKLRRIMLPGSTSGPLGFAPDGKTFAAATGTMESKIRIWDVATGAERPAIRCHGRVSTLAFAPDGTRLVTGMADTTALVWHLNAISE